MPKENAQKCKEYRERQREKQNKPKKGNAKTSAQRMRECRLRRQAKPVNQQWNVVIQNVVLDSNPSFSSQSNSTTDKPVSSNVRRRSAERSCYLRNRTAHQEFSKKISKNADRLCFRHDLKASVPEQEEIWSTILQQITREDYRNKTRFDDTEKPQKTLTLNEKIVAILRYEVDPVYKSVAQHFSCCPSEIRQTIQKKDEILKKWDNQAKKFEVTLSRKRNTISFLSIALYEWIRRTLYYSDFKLTDAIIQMMAIEFKNALNLPNFFPDQAWVDNFRKTYNLRYGSTKKLSIRYQESMSVQIGDILIYLDSIGGSSEAFPVTAISALLPSVNYTETAALATEHKYAGSFCAPSTSAAALSGRSNTTPAPSTIEKEPLHIKAEPEDAVSTDHKVITLKEAKYYVKQLEEYALMRENFRLIGLVERLEEALKEEM